MTRAAGCGTVAGAIGVPGASGVRVMEFWGVALWGGALWGAIVIDG
jgi:hypothetical protein